MCEGKVQTASGAMAESSYRYNAERYYETHGALPLPETIHATLRLEESKANTKTNKSKNAEAKNVLIIGDIHGCYDELILLHEKAVKANGGKPFRAIISVGDLTAKGPKSSSVIRHFHRNSEANGGNWYAVRGNNDDGTLKAVLKDSVRMHQAKYDFVKDLEDDDVEYMGELPYTITIPASILEQDANDRSTKDGKRQNAVQKLTKMVGCTSIMSRYRTAKARTIASAALVKTRA